MRHRCDCQGCIERDARTLARRFAAIVETFTHAERAHLYAVAESDATPIGAILGAVPQWNDGAEPNEDGA